MVASLLGFDSPGARSALLFPFRAPAQRSQTPLTAGLTSDGCRGGCDEPSRPPEAFLGSLELVGGLNGPSGRCPPVQGQRREGRGCAVSPPPRSGTVAWPRARASPLLLS